MAMRMWFWIYIVAINAVGLAVVAHDKRAARRGARRVPEDVLVLLPTLGAWPLQALGFVWLRHKTRKRGFLLLFAVASVIGTVVWSYVFMWAAVQDLF